MTTQRKLNQGSAEVWQVLQVICKADKYVRLYEHIKVSISASDNMSPVNHPLTTVATLTICDSEQRYKSVYSSTVNRYTNMCVVV